MRRSYIYKPEATSSLCSGHGSFSNSRTLNDLVGNLTHSSILVPYHGWRISHRTHHQNHGHVENDESWHPVSKNLYDKMVGDHDPLRLYGRTIHLSKGQL